MSPVSLCTTVFVSKKALPTNKQAMYKGQSPAVCVGKASVTTPALAAQEIATVNEGRGPERSNHRPAEIANKAGKSATLASIVPTSNELAPAAIASSVTQNRIPVVQECMISNMKRTFARVTYICVQQ